MKAIPLKRSRLIEILNAFNTLTVGVIGDFALDAYWHVDMSKSELSRETPLFNRPVVDERYTPGAAANVAENFSALGVKKINGFTLIGDDWRGQLLINQLRESHINLDHAIITPDYTTLFYAKIMLTAHGLEQEDSRLDFINTHDMCSQIEEQLFENFQSNISTHDVIAIADYQPTGIVTEALRNRLNGLAQQHPEIPFIVDSRDHIFEFEHMILKPNDVEAQASSNNLNSPIDSPSPLIAIGKTHAQRTQKPLYITRGAQGCLVFEHETWVELPAIHLTPPVDPVGAGDTFLAAVSCCLGAGATPTEAGQIASLASVVILKKLRTTGSASPQEIIEVFDTKYHQCSTP
jgi:rfaE bifunctional protein kinase chain/domain